MTTLAAACPVCRREIVVESGLARHLVYMMVKHHLQRCAQRLDEPARRDLAFQITDDPRRWRTQD
jgi:hypothetical protein